MASLNFSVSSSSLMPLILLYSAMIPWKGVKEVHSVLSAAGYQIALSPLHAMVMATIINCESNEVFYLFITTLFIPLLTQFCCGFFFFNLIQGCLDNYFAPYHECIKSNQTSTTQLLCQYPTLNLQTHLKYTTATTKYYFRHL